MGEVDFLDHLEGIATADGCRGSGPFTHPIHGQRHRLLERRGEEGRGRVALVMFGEKQAARPVIVGVEAFELARQQVLLKELFAQPQRHGHAKGGESTRCEGEIGLQQAFEFEKRFVVEDDEIHPVEADAGLFQAIADGVNGKAGIMLLAGEALFLGGGDDAPVPDQDCGAVVIEGGDA